MPTVDLAATCNGEGAYWAHSTCGAFATDNNTSRGLANDLTGNDLLEVKELNKVEIIN